MSEEYVRVNVTLTPEDLDRLADLAAATGRTRSELIREAVRAYRPPSAPGTPAPDPGRALELLRTTRVRLPMEAVSLIRAMREGRPR